MVAVFPDLSVEIEELVAEGDIVVERSTVTGTQQAEWFGVPATGRCATWTAIAAYRVTGGKIVEQWLAEDWAHVLQQAGALPADQAGG